MKKGFAVAIGLRLSEREYQNSRRSDKKACVNRDALAKVALHLALILLQKLELGFVAGYVFIHDIRDCLSANI